MKSFLLNLLSKISSFGLSAGIALFLTPFLVAHLGKDVYGFYPLANNFVGYIAIFTVAINSLATRYISLAYMDGDFGKASIYFSSIFFANIAMIAILTMPLIVFVNFLDFFLKLPAGYSNSIKILFALVFLSMFVSMLSAVFASAVFAQKRIDLHSLVEILQGAGKVFFYLLLFWLFPPEIYLVGCVALLVALIFFFMHWSFARRLLPEVRLSIHYFKMTAVAEVFFSGIWNTVNQLGSMLLFTVSLLLANVILGADALGSLSIVQTIPFFINSFISAVILVFFPEMMERYAKKDIPGLISQIRFAQKILGMTTCIGIAIFIVQGTDFFRLWLPEENAADLQLLSILTTLRLAIVACVWPLTYLNIIMNQLKVPALTLIGIGILNCIVTVIVLKNSNWGLYVIPICLAIISSLWFIFFLPIYSSRSLGVNWITFFSPLFRILPLLGVLLGVGYAIKHFSVIDTWIKLILWSGVLLGVFFVVSLVWTFGVKDSFIIIQKMQIAITRYYKNILISIS